jgi:hypothetical protein
MSIQQMLLKATSRVLVPPSAQPVPSLDARTHLGRQPGELTRLADRYRSDKGTRHSAHGYTRVYERFFGRMRHEALTLVEIGLLRVDVDARRAHNGAQVSTGAAASRAPSLEMWRAYFRNATIFGFDIDDFSSVRIDRGAIVQGDMGSPADLERLARAIGGPIDILIEDGSHASHHQQIALGTLFPHLRSQGIYVVEDMHWQDPHVEKAGAPKTRDILRRFQVAGELESPFMTREQAIYIQENVHEIWLFDSLTADVVDATDALAVLVKR